MAKYLKLFDTHAEYESFIQTDFDKPNVSYCKDNNEVHYNPVETRLICKYNVTSTSEPTVLRADEENIFKSMEIDGVMIDELVTEYTFDTTGIHTVKYELYDETKLGDYVFQDCSSLTSIDIPNSVTSIGHYAFCNCSDLTSITIPNSMTSIGNSTFYKCSGLTSVTIPNSVTSIGTGTFEECRGLTSVTIGNSVTSIGDYAFRFCTNLTSIDIPNSVTSISEAAFYKCSSLTSVTIGSGVTSIGDNAFYNCSSLTSIRSLAMAAPTIQSSTFQNVKTNGTLTVPSGSTGYDTWMTTSNYYLGKYNWTKVEQ